MKIKFKIPFTKHQYIKVSFIGVFSIFIFLFLANVFVSQKHYFDTVYTISIIIVIWLGCSAIIFLIDKKYKWQEKAIKRLIIELPTIIVFSVVVYMLFEYIPKAIHKEKINWEEVKTSAVFTGVFTVLIVAIAESVDMMQAWKASLLKSKELEKENIEAQFHTLKNQVNPHFLFNSLNTLANYVQDNQQASDYLQNLSEYLRYTLVLKDDKLTTIQKELSIVKRYYFLQKSRFKDGLNLNMETNNKLLNEAYIPPFSLQILIENAIKHNVVSKSKPLYIKIIAKDADRIAISNNLQPKEVLNSTKIGLKNIQERYKLLTNKEVIIEKTKNEFKVSLPIICKV